MHSRHAYKLLGHRPVRASSFSIKDGQGFALESLDVLKELDVCLYTAHAGERLHKRPTLLLEQGSVSAPLL